MNEVLLPVLAFIVAIGVLVTVHEFGHFWVARRLGIKVLRFSIGFGKPLWMKTFGQDRTELVIAAIPLGGYVKMLDEREGDVPGEEKHRAFNRQSIGTRSAVVIAGPLFNFLFAIFAYWVMFVAGVPGLRPLVGDVAPASYAAEAGFISGDEILSVQNNPTPTWESVVMALLDAGLAGERTFEVTVRGPGGEDRALQVHMDTPDELFDKGGVLENFGLDTWQPPAMLDRIVEGGAGDRAGLLAGDLVLTADGEPVRNWGQWVEYVRARPGQAIQLQLLRDGIEIETVLTPKPVIEDGESIGRIGAYVRLPGEEQRATMRVVVRYGLLEAVPAALEKTFEITSLTYRTLWKMVVGKASVENLSGPISIARYAGQSAAAGLAAFLGFLGIVSVSLGVLNLLPVPVLDGGHLLFYLVELLKGSPMSDAAQLIGQKIGITLLLGLMMLAFYNDLSRLLN
ncbi:MAG: RIP metalloprotease RseP [Gammaproteobacteria bacterium]|nr:RIP metalloprotease RseP [Gammaproteobacteria bacterium]